MSHPFNHMRQHKVELERVGKLTKGYAHGGAVHSDAAEDKPMIAKAVHKHEKHMHKGEKETKLATGGKVRMRLDRRARGGKVKHRADGGQVKRTSEMTDAERDAQNAMGSTGSSSEQTSAPVSTDDMNRMNSMGKKRGGRAQYARGGKVKSKGATNVTVVVAPQGGKGDMAPAESPMPAMGAGMPAPPGPASPPPPMMKPPMAPGMPPGMPMRARGGRISDGPAWKEGLKHGTPVQHTDGKNDGADIYRGKQITYARGGKIEAGNERGPRMTAGAGTEMGREQKMALQKHSKRP